MRFEYKASRGDSVKKDKHAVRSRLQLEWPVRKGDKVKGQNEFERFVSTVLQPTNDGENEEERDIPGYKG